jgi:hypothetical protein
MIFFVFLWFGFTTRKEVVSKKDIRRILPPGLVTPTQEETNSRKHEQTMYEKRTQGEFVRERERKKKRGQEKNCDVTVSVSFCLSHLFPMVLVSEDLPSFDPSLRYKKLKLLCFPKKNCDNTIRCPRCRRRHIGECQGFWWNPLRTNILCQRFLLDMTSETIDEVSCRTQQIRLGYPVLWSIQFTWSHKESVCGKQKEIPESLDLLSLNGDEEQRKMCLWTFSSVEILTLDTMAIHDRKGCFFSFFRTFPWVIALSMI